MTTRTRCLACRPMVTELLPEDGVIDPVAVDIAVRAVRPVALTRRERDLAARRLLDAGTPPSVIARRLRMNGRTLANLRELPPAA